MRALPAIAVVLVTLVASGRAHAELPHLLARVSNLAVGAAPGRRAVAAVVTPPLARRPNLNLVSTTTVPPPPSRGLIAMTRVEGFAVHTLRPTLPLRSRTVRSLNVGPTWPLGAAVTIIYGATGRP